MTTLKNIYAKVSKIDESLGLIIGFAIVCKENNEPYFDSQGDHIPEQSMLEAATDFMINSRVAKESHNDGKIGSIVFAWPLTEDIAKALDITTKKTGLLIAMRTDDEDILKKFVSGEYTGFSIGGRRVQDEEVKD